MTHTFYKTRKDITNWLNKAEIENYSLVPDIDYGLVVNVVGSVILKHLTIPNFPVKFNVVKKDFICSNCELYTLLGAPHSVGGNFDVTVNNLTSLLGAPSIVGKNFNCSYNNLNSLLGAPQNINKAFLAANNSLTNLVGIPKKIKGFLDLANNKINTLQFIPQNVMSYIYLVNNPQPQLKNIDPTLSFNQLYHFHTQDVANYEKKLLNNNIKKQVNSVTRSISNPLYRDRFKLKI